MYLGSLVSGTCHSGEIKNRRRYFIQYTYRFSLVSTDPPSLKSTQATQAGKGGKQASRLPSFCSTHPSLRSFSPVQGPSRLQLGNRPPLCDHIQLSPSPPLVRPKPKLFLSLPPSIFTSCSLQSSRHPAAGTQDSFSSLIRITSLYDFETRHFIAPAHESVAYYAQMTRHRYTINITSRHIREHRSPAMSAQHALSEPQGSDDDPFAWGPTEPGLEFSNDTHHDGANGGYEDPRSFDDPEDTLALLQGSIESPER